MKIDDSSFGLKSVRVFVEEDPVGEIAMTGRGVVAFEYDSHWINNGFSISPLSLPLQPGVFVAKAHPLDGLFGIFDDSLPDGWGRLLVDRMLSSKGVNPARINAVDRLAIVGSSGMGALRYEPDRSTANAFARNDVDALADECARILNDQPSSDIDEIFALGGSSGGARPKVFAEIDNEPWIIKFPSSYDSEDIGAIEFQCSQFAKACGIEMPETKLVPSKQCPGYFAVKRFDRKRQGDGSLKRIHMASAAALLETSHRIPNLDYDVLMKLTLKLTSSMAEVEKMYTLMCFNAVIGNRDDHSKNFSFIYDASASKWKLSPAYDLTPNAGTYGERATTINGKGRGVTANDLLAVGLRAGLREKNATEVLERTIGAVPPKMRALDN